MKLRSITANRYVYEGQAEPKPLRLLLEFDDAPPLRLQVAGDGERMIVDEGPLDDPFDMEVYGQVDVADVTQSLFSTLSGFDVTEVEALRLNGKQVGVKLHALGQKPFHFWVDGDNLRWGDRAALVAHDWLDGVAPSESGRIQL
jgi:hypothetical protein